MSRKVTVKLSTEEWVYFRQIRGSKLTRFPHHTVPFNGPYRKTYYWPMGGQPDEKLIDVIAARCPIKAAEKFLRYYQRCSGLHAEGRGWAEPKPREGTPVWMHQATFA